MENQCLSQIQSIFFVKLRQYSKTVRGFTTFDEEVQYLVKQLKEIEQKENTLYPTLMP